MKRSSGVLLSVSSLPGPYGVGVLGWDAKNWIDRLSDMGFGWWQVLPTVPGGKGNSPYSGVSAFAGNPAYIDPDQLVDRGLISPGDAALCRWTGDPNRAAYEFAAESRLACLRKAFANASGIDEELEVFVRDNAWALDYARFMALKQEMGGAYWWEWPQAFRGGKTAHLQEKLAEEVRFRIFVQYEFRRQWYELRTYARMKDVRIIGDLPIYVSPDSADVWANPGVFALDEEGLPAQVAGVPPDFFCADGQLWGNPLYDWESCKADGYSWWIERLRQAGNLYDLTRIDHFRGFCSYWAIPAQEKTARNGVWMKGPGADLFRVIRDKLPGLSLFAEDLGDCGEDVAALLRETGIPGTKVLQFGFGGDSAHTPHNYPRSCVAYTGTHDNTTLLSWLFEIPQWERERALRYAGFAGGDWGEGGRNSASCRALIETLWKSAADLTVAPLQDLCGYGSDTRMNSPGTAQGNWLFRATQQTFDNIDSDYYREINALFGRT